MLIMVKSKKHSGGEKKKLKKCCSGSNEVCLDYILSNFMRVNGYDYLIHTILKREKDKDLRNYIKTTLPSKEKIKKLLKLTFNELTKIYVRKQDFLKMLIRMHKNQIRKFIDCIHIAHKITEDAFWKRIKQCCIKELKEDWEYIRKLVTHTKNYTDHLLEVCNAKNQPKTYSEEYIINQLIDDIYKESLFSFIDCINNWKIFKMKGSKSSFEFLEKNLIKSLNYLKLQVDGNVKRSTKKKGKIGKKGDSESPCNSSIKSSPLLDGKADDGFQSTTRNSKMTLSAGNEIHNNKPGAGFVQESVPNNDTSPSDEDITSDRFANNNNSIISQQDHNTSQVTDNDNRIENNIYKELNLEKIDGGGSVTYSDYPRSLDNDFDYCDNIENSFP